MSILERYKPNGATKDMLETFSPHIIMTPENDKIAF